MNTCKCNKYFVLNDTKRICEVCGLLLPQLITASPRLHEADGGELGVGPLGDHPTTGLTAVGYALLTELNA